MQPSSSHAVAAPVPTESVRRPDPGLARGRWEAPAWFFWAILAVVLVSALVYLLQRVGILRLRKAAPEAPPTSTRARRP